MSIKEKMNGKDGIPSSVYRHSNELGAGAAKRRSLKPKQKIEAVMHEFKRGTLHSGSGNVIRDRQQAIAVAMSESRQK